jgi:NADH-quinone oxidoreductase subunit M
MFMIAMLGSAGLPGLVGFIGEFLVLVGTFTHGGLTLFQVPWLVAVAATGLILGAVYLLWLFQRLMFGPVTNPKNVGLADLGLREKIVFLPIIALIVLMGVYPQPFTARIDPTAQAAVAQFNLRRCASIRHALGEAPVLLETLASKCADPVGVIAGTYGDERPGAQKERRKGDAAAASAKGGEAKAPEGKAPEAKAPEGKAPEGKAPEGKAPGGRAPAGRAPAGRAPEGKAPEGKAGGKAGNP